MEPPLCYDQDFMAQCCSHRWGSTVFLYCSFLIVDQQQQQQQQKVRQLDYGN